MDLLAVILIALAVVLMSIWISWTTTRLDRLANRVDAARASLDAQLVRRSAALQAFLDSSPGLPGADRMRALALAALEADDAERESAENDLGRELAALPDGGDAARRQDLAEASVRVVLARRFYNDAVRDTHSLRGSRLSRMLRLSGGRPAPTYFEIADVVVDPQEVRRAGSSHDE